MANNGVLKDSSGEIILPLTTIDQVQDTDGTSLRNVMTTGTAQAEALSDCNSASIIPGKYYCIGSGSTSNMPYDTFYGFFKETRAAAGDWRRQDVYGVDGRADFMRTKVSKTGAWTAWRQIISHGSDYFVPEMMNGWTNINDYDGLHVVSLDGKIVSIGGLLSAPATVTGDAICKVPTGFIPYHQVWVTGVDTTGKGCIFRLDTSGVLYPWGALPTASTTVCVGYTTYPIT